ncbi:hypothetical protein BJX63DRAFT_431103 [Aspergillus granulosus]|uniref:Uncharacterized protein n=1 Tax=Aspergillus granulosus TaxID=176169 RepID=A0ABR4HHN2_9EURO
MSYKSNYEPYASPSSSSTPCFSSHPQTSQSLDLNRVRPSDELLYPLGGLYPHVVALQLQSHEENLWSAAHHAAGYHDLSYWNEVVSSPRSLPEHYSKHALRRYSESTKSRFVSRIRQFLSRDDLRKRR